MYVHMYVWEGWEGHVVGGVGGHVVGGVAGACGGKSENWHVPILTLQLRT